MKQRKHDAAERAPEDDPAQRFARPDAATAEAGSPPHEEPKPEPGEENEARERSDREHGYTQDAGYRSSGGHTSSEARDVERARTVQRSGDGLGHSDQKISDDVRSCLVGAPAPRASRLRVSVADGVVTLTGEVESQPERERLLGLVRSVSSVRDVTDQLVVRSPSSKPN